MKMENNGSDGQEGDVAKRRRSEGGEEEEEEEEGDLVTDNGTASFGERKESEVVMKMENNVGEFVEGEGQEGKFIFEGDVAVKRRRSDEEELVDENGTVSFGTRKESEGVNFFGRTVLDAKTTKNKEDAEGISDLNQVKEKAPVRRGRKGKVGRPRKKGNRRDLGGEGEGIGKDSAFDNNCEVVRESGDLGGKGEGFVEGKKGAKPRGRKRKGNSVDLDGKRGEIDSVEKTNDQGDQDKKESGDLGGKREENYIGIEGLVKEKETDKMASDQIGSSGKELEEGVSVNKRTLRQRAVKLEDRFCDQVEKFFEEQDGEFGSKKRRRRRRDVEKVVEEGNDGSEKKWRKGMRKEAEEEDDGSQKKSRKGMKKEVEEVEDGSPETVRGEEPCALETVGKTGEAVSKQKGGRKTDDNVFSVFSRLY